MKTSVAAPDPDDGARRIAEGSITVDAITTSGLNASSLGSSMLPPLTLSAGSVTTLSIKTTGA